MAVGSFSAGLSGLNANAQALSVIGNNLANINTVGYKASSVSFQDLVSQNVGGASINPAQVGLGVGLGTVSPIFSQGAIESSRMNTHVAVQGNGFFVLDGTAGRSYTRAGNFSFNNDGALVTPDGQFVRRARPASLRASASCWRYCASSCWASSRSRSAWASLPSMPAVRCSTSRRKIGPPWRRARACAPGSR